MIRGGGEKGASWQLDGTLNREKTFQDLVCASRWIKKNLSVEGKRVVAVGRSFGGLTTAVHYVHHQKEFDLISSIVPVTDWVSHFNGSGWWMDDDFGIRRFETSGDTTPIDALQLTKSVQRWNPMDNLFKLRRQKESLIPAIFFSGQYDTNTTPHQTFRFVNQVLRLRPEASIYMVQHKNVGHGGRAELVDELLFISKFFNLRELRSLTFTSAERGR